MDSSYIKLGLRIAILFTLIIGAFSFLSKAITLLPSNFRMLNGYNHFLVGSSIKISIWMLFLVTIMISLLVAIRRTEGSVRFFEYFKDKNVSFATGILVISDGILNIGNLASMIILQAVNISKVPNDLYKDSLSRTIQGNIPVFAILIIQIGFGIYIAMLAREKSVTNLAEENSV